MFLSHSMYSAEVTAIHHHYNITLLCIIFIYSNPVWLNRINKLGFKLQARNRATTCPFVIMSLAGCLILLVHPPVTCPTKIECYDASQFTPCPHACGCFSTICVLLSY